MMYRIIHNNRPVSAVGTLTDCLTAVAYRIADWPIRRSVTHAQAIAQGYRIEPVRTPAVCGSSPIPE